MNKGKAYANKKKEKDRPKGDFYSTPKSLVWVAKDIIEKEFKTSKILEPACGKMAISEELELIFLRVRSTDLHHKDGKNRFNYFSSSPNFNAYSHIITNPPFSLWDEFVVKAKTHCTKFMFIGRLNYLGTVGRHNSGLWKNLKAVYPFNRYVDYQTPYRKDGHFHAGAMATAWFLWDMKYKGEPTIKTLDVQKYATLGAFNK